MRELGLCGAARWDGKELRSLQHAKAVAARAGLLRARLVVTHTYRKTTATSIKEAGLDDLAASDQLGHAHFSMTQNVYYGRNKIRREVADILDGNIGHMLGFCWAVQKIGPGRNVRNML